MYPANLYYQPNTTFLQEAKISLSTFMNSVSLITPLHPKKQNNKLRVLSIDGGGIRAILPAIILAELEEQLKKESGNPEASIVDYFDLFAGTSAGSILITLYLTPSEQNAHKPKFTAKEVLEIYLRDGCKSFMPINPDASKARTEKYYSATLEGKLKNLLGENNTINQLLKPTFITAFNTRTESPVYFKSWNDRDCKVWQVVRASAAAPGMFKPAIVDQFNEEKTLVDGSIFAGNPSMCAYALASNTRFSKISGCAYAKDFPSSKNMVFLSLGTGKELPAESTPKGSWIRSMMKNVMSSGIELAHQQLQQLFSTPTGNNYFRLNPILPSLDNDIDNVGSDNVGMLYQIGKIFLNENKKIISQLVKYLM